jgi:IS1 family transposase
MVRNGHDYKGDQKYCCKACESYGTLLTQRGDDEHTRNQVKHAVLERISLRGIERLFGISRQRLARVARKTLSFSKLDRFHEAVFRLFVHHYN